jgi:CRP-like cAMP-binding protein
MFRQLIEKLQKDKANWDKVKSCFIEIEIPSKTVLLKEGDPAQNIYFIKKGCLRLWFNDDGKDITFQFFFENQAVASIESFLGEKPSRFSLESIEPSKIVYVEKNDYNAICELYPDLKIKFNEILIQRMGNYANLFLSRIKDNPQKRYEDLLENHPEIIKRIPQHYIASYLGITPISLSRIRNRK